MFGPILPVLDFSSPVLARYTRALPLLRPAGTSGAAERAEVRAVERKLSMADEFDVESPTATAE